jgi:hypothetical protein
MSRGYERYLLKCRTIELRESGEIHSDVWYELRDIVEDDVIKRVALTRDKAWALNRQLFAAGFRLVRISLRYLAEPSSF